MYLSGRNQLLTDMTLAEGFQVLKEAGADAVELCHENPAMGPDQMGQSLAGEIAAALEGAGLRASASGWHCDFVVEDTAYSRLPDLIPLARTLDTDVFIVAGAKDGADRSLWAPMVERTRSLCAVAEDCGVRLAVEYEPGFLVGDSASLLRLFEEVGSPALAANLDLGHAFLCEDEPLDAVRQLGPWIVHCHIENMAAGVHRHLLPWQG
ncbi:MAG: sugar phosphate isomerase/epimerase family protein, partial [Planctomycetota bacterium]